MAPPTPSPDEIALALRALADRRRYDILMQLAAADAPVACCALAQNGRISPSTLSHHLSQLEQAGLIEVTRDGRAAILQFRRARYEAVLRRMAESAAPAGADAPPP